MSSQLNKMFRAYGRALCCYVARPHEDLLHQAYELGRKAIAQGLGVLDVARIHQQALASSLGPSLLTQRRRTLKAAETFFMETLSPFEAAHRGFRAANLKLQELNRTLEHRNRQLARINRQLEREVNERRRTERALRSSEDSLRNLSSQMLHVQEEERQRISRELHDEVGGDLAAIHVNLALASRNGGMDGKRLNQKLLGAQRLLGRTIDTVHRFACELRPAMLDELGLLPALRSHLKGVAERTRLRVRFQGSPEAEHLNIEQKTVVFRIAQESLTNVVKHAQARQVAVTLRARKDGVRMQVKDDGKAFQVEQQLFGAGKKRLGLLGMQERVRLVNGRFTVRSAPGKGTTVNVEIPFRAGGNPIPAK